MPTPASVGPRGGESTAMYTPGGTMLIGEGDIDMSVAPLSSSEDAQDTPHRMDPANLTVARRGDVLPSDFPTLFPTPIANMVTAMAATTRLSLSVTAFFTEIILEGSQYGTRVGLEYTRRVLISAISTARNAYIDKAAKEGDGDKLDSICSDVSCPNSDSFIDVLDRWTNLGIYVIHHTFTLAELFTMSGFYLTSNTVQSATYAASESVQLLDSLFGSNESSRALSAIIMMVKKEYVEDERFHVKKQGTVAVITALTKALTAFACLQNATWERSSERMRMRVLYDCTVTVSDGESTATRTLGPPIVASRPSIASRRQQQVPFLQDVDVDGDMSMDATPQGRTSLPSPRTPTSRHNDELELLLQIEDLVGDRNDYTSPKKRDPEAHCPSSPESRRSRRHKRVRSDMFEITDELQESTIVTQTISRLGLTTNPSSPEQRRTTSYVSMPDVRVESMDEGMELDDNQPATPIPTPVVEEDESEWIEVDHLLDDRTGDAPSAENGLVHTRPVSLRSPASSEKIQLVLRTMTNKLLQRKRTVRRVTKMSTSPSPPPDSRSPSPFAASIAAPVVAQVAATMDRSERGEPSPSSSSRTVPPRAFSDSTAGPSTPPKSRPVPVRAATVEDGNKRNPIASSFRSVLRRKPSIAISETSSGATTPRAKSKGKRPASPVSPISPKTPTAKMPTSPTLSVPPPTPYGLPQSQSRRFESIRTKSNRIHTSSSQIFTHQDNETPASLFPHEGLIKNIHRFMRYSSAAYGQHFLRIFGLGNSDYNFPTTGRYHANAWAFAQHTNIPIDALLLSSFTESSNATIPDKAPPLVHYIAVEHNLKAIVLTCRGTLGLQDILVDLTFTYRDVEVEGADPSGSYYVHSGMYDSATHLMAKHNRVHEVLKAALEKYPDYGLVLCGHSLGGGVASLLAIESSVPAAYFEKENAARKNSVQHPALSTPFVTSFASGLPAGRPIHCYAYGVPAVTSADLARHASGLITSVIQNTDIVPTLSIGGFRDLKNIAITLFEEKGVAEEIVSRVLGLNRTKLKKEVDTSEEQALSDWLWSLIKTLRADMDNEKLYPPGTVYVMEYFDVCCTTDKEDILSGAKATSNQRAQRVILRVCESVEERFREVLFSKTMLKDHMPGHYERSTYLLYEGLGQGLL